MSWKNLIPWDWFKHEEKNQGEQNNIPVTRGELPRNYRNENPIVQLHDEIERIFNDSLNHFGMPSLRSRLFEPGTLIGENLFRPSLNVSSTDDNYIISVEMPGMNEKDVSVELNKDVLTIKGEKKEEQEEKDGDFYRTERRYGSFQRVLSLPEDADAESIDAKMKDGVLSLHIQRKQLESSQVKKIAIN